MMEILYPEKSARHISRVCFALSAEIAGGSMSETACLTCSLLEFGRGNKLATASFRRSIPCFHKCPNPQSLQPTPKSWLY